jgi:hypothetical protein
LKIWYKKKIATIPKGVMGFTSKLQDR